MLNKIALQLVGWLMNRELTVEQRNSLTSYILDNLDALPIRGIIDINDSEEILINGRSLDLDKAMQLKESALIAIDNVALKLITEQVIYAAIVGGIHKASTPLEMYFYRAAIWFGQEQEKLLKTLAQRTE